MNVKGNVRKGVSRPSFAPNVESSVANDIAKIGRLRVQERGSGGEGENCEQVGLFHLFSISPSMDSMQRVPFKIKGEFLLGIFL